MWLFKPIRSRAVSISILLFLAVAETGRGQTLYSITDLGTLGGEESFVTKVNSAGQAVGWAHDDDGIRNAVLWLPEPAYGFPAGINRLLPQPLDEWDSSEACAINDSGHILIASTYRSYSWLPEPLYGLEAGLNENPACGGCAYCDLNNHGQIVSGFHLWLPEPDYGRPAGWTQLWWWAYDWYRDAYLISDNGLVAGIQQTLTSVSPIFMDLRVGDVTIPPTGILAGANALDQIVGGPRLAERDDGGEWIVHELSGLVFPDFRFSNWGAVDINDFGQIVGRGTTLNDNSHAILVDPVSADLDDDERVDLNDFRLWSTCLTGPTEDVAESCSASDLSRDNHVDLVDFFGIQNLFSEQ